MGEFFRKEGFQVHYSEIDCDDTLAAYAQYYGADILSNDKDFYRYKGRTYDVYCDFEIKNNTLILIPKDEEKYQKIV